MAAGAGRQWCARNELIDWLALFGERSGFVRDTQRAGYDERLDFQRYVAAQGERFEAVVREHLGHQVPLTRIGGEARSRQAAVATWEAMARGDSAIADGVLRDPQGRRYGRVDLLVRSDTLAALCPDAFRDDDPPHAPAPAFEGAPWHYRVVDVKFSTLTLLASGELSTAPTGDLSTMAQVWSYNEALGRMQGLTPPVAYVLGRGWRQGKLRGDVSWERLGRVPYDAYVKAFELSLGDAVAAAGAWIRRLRRDGAAWRVLPVPSAPELWPNLRADGDGGWHLAKREIAEALGELTLLRTVGPQHRGRAHAAGVTRWDDPRTSAALLGVTGERAPQVLDAILAVHQAGPPVRPARVTADDERWRERAPLECYVDFETVNDVADDFAAFPRKGGQSQIFQIGCGRFDDGQWTFRQFTARGLTVEAEGELIDEWLAHLEELARERGLASAAEARLFHWSAAETVFMDDPYASARARHPERGWPDLGWYDLYRNVVFAQPVVVRGAKSFGLKAFARALHANGLIPTDWGEGLADGTGAMAGAWTAAEEARLRGVPLSEVALMREIDRYNEIDCRVMAEALDHLRREH